MYLDDIFDSGSEDKIASIKRKLRLMVDNDVNLVKLLLKNNNYELNYIELAKPEELVDMLFDVIKSNNNIMENLRQWFKEKWVRFGPDGKIRGDCARGDDSEGKPKCLPQSKAHSLGKKGRASAASRKRREDPNPERSGPAINVATKKKSVNEFAPTPDRDDDSGQPRWLVTYDIYGTNRDKPLYTSSKKIYANSAKEAIELCKKFFGGRNFRVIQINESIAEGEVQKQETPQQEKVRTAIANGMLKKTEMARTEYYSKPTNTTFFDPQGYASDRLTGIDSIDPDGTVVISIGDNDTAEWVKKLAALGGMPGVKTRQTTPTLKNADVAEGAQPQFVAARYIDEFADGEHWYVKGTPEVIKRFVQMANSLEDESVKGTEYEPDKGMMAKVHAQLGDDSIPQWQIVQAQNLEAIKPIGNRVLQLLMQPDLSYGTQEFMSEFLWTLEEKGLALVTGEPQQGVAESFTDDLDNIYAMHPQPEKSEQVVFLITGMTEDEFSNLWTDLPDPYQQEFGYDLPLWDADDLSSYPNLAVKRITFDQYVQLVGNYIKSEELAGSTMSKMKQGLAEGDFDKWGGEIKTPPANWKKNLKQPTSPAKLAKQQAANRQRQQQKVAESPVQWHNTETGVKDAAQTDHTMDEALEYLKTNYPVVKMYNVRRAAMGLSALDQPKYFDTGDEADINKNIIRNSAAHMSGVDSAVDYLQLRKNAMMSGSQQVTFTIGYSWSVYENPNNGIAMLYYQDRGMAWDEIYLAGKTPKIQAQARQVFRDAGVLPTPIKKTKQQGVAKSPLNEFAPGDSDDWEDPFDNYPCYDCGSTIFLHHTKLCDLAEDNAIRDLPAEPGSQHWTGEIPKGLTPIPGLQEGVLNEFAPNDSDNDDNSVPPNRRVTELAKEWLQSQKDWDAMQWIENTLEHYGYKIRLHRSRNTGELYVVVRHKDKKWDDTVDVSDLHYWTIGELKQDLSEEQINELKCWPGYTRVRSVPAGAPGSCKKKTNEEKSKHIDSDTVRRIQELLNKKFNANLDVDGILGPLTIQSLKKFLPKTAKKAAPNPERNTAVQGLEMKEEKCPECGGPMFNEMLLNEKKDACYYKVKSRYKVWPSAYASGALVKCRKKGAKNWGNKSESIEENKIYFSIPKSLENEQELKESFKLSKDNRGWYLKENQENFKQKYMNALKAFIIIK